MKYTAQVTMPDTTQTTTAVGERNVWTLLSALLPRRLRWLAAMLPHFR